MLDVLLLLLVLHFISRTLLLVKRQNFSAGRNVIATQTHDVAKPSWVIVMASTDEIHRYLSLKYTKRYADRHGKCGDTFGHHWIMHDAAINPF